MNDNLNIYYRIEYKTYKIEMTREFHFVHPKSEYEKDPRFTLNRDLRIIFGSIVLENCNVFSGKPVSIKFHVVSIEKDEV